MRNYKLHLIRHGLTLGNLESRYVGGGTDESLCEKGRQGIYFLKENYDYPVVSQVYTSPMKRAVETCEILYPDQDYVAVDALTECNFGEFENMSFDELSKNERFAQWLSHEKDFVPQGGESNEEFAKRCLRGIDAMLTDMMKNQTYEAVCVCHGGVIALLLGMLSYPQKPFHQWTSDSGCGFTVITSVEMWTRDNIIEAVAIVPEGWGAVPEMDDEALDSDEDK